MGGEGKTSERRGEEQCPRGGTAGKGKLTKPLGVTDCTRDKKGEVVIKLLGLEGMAGEGKELSGKQWIEGEGVRKKGKFEGRKKEDLDLGRGHDVKTGICP